MKKLTIRINPDTLEEIDIAARNAGLGRSVYIRTKLEQIFDGTPHNPLGVRAEPKFYKQLSDALAIIMVLGNDFTPARKVLMERKAEGILDNLEISHEH